MQLRPEFQIEVAENFKNIFDPKPINRIVLSNSLSSDLLTRKKGIKYRFVNRSVTAFETKMRAKRFREGGELGLAAILLPHAVKPLSSAFDLNSKGCEF